MSIINGHSSPLVKLFDPRNPNEPRFTINLPLANSEGLVESYQVRKISHELISPGLEGSAITSRQVILGYMISFTLHYSRFISGEDLYDGIRRIFDAAKADWKIILVPRADAPWREFEVLLANETLELGLNKGGRKANSHRLPVLIFKTRGLVPDLNWFPPRYDEPEGGEFIPVSGSN